MFLIDSLFIAFMVVVIISSIVCAEFESFFFSALVIGAAVVTAHFFFDIPVIQYVLENPMLMIPGLLGYLIVGSLYTILWRWPNWIENRQDSIQRSYNRYCIEYNLEKTSASLAEFIQSTEYKTHYGPAQNKESISVWVMMWPFVLFWELLHKPITWLWEVTYKAISSSLVSVGNRTASKNIKFD